MKRLSLALLMFAPILAAQDRSHGRSMVISQQGIAATSHTLASQAAAQVLAKGGTAADAAIAANAMLGVTEPMMNGVGGDLFVLYWEAKTGKLTGLNASGWAPQGLTPELLAAKGLKEMPKAGIHSVTVPGAVRGWKALHERFGKLAWADLFKASIHYAEQGYPVPEIIQANWAIAADADPKFTAEAARVFLPGGKVPQVGQIFRNPDLGGTMRLIAQQGPAAFYKGEIAQAILKTSARLGGTMTAEDLAAWESEWVEPIWSEYRGWRVAELPPNGQGMAALQMLNVMEQFKPAAAGARSAEEIHKRVEAMKLAYADLYAYVADPKFSAVPVAPLLNKAYAAERAKLIDMTKARCDVPAGKPVHGDTTYLAVVDRDGNIASVIQSIAAAWGSGVTVEGKGFMLHNRGSGFVLKQGHPNLLAGRKRPFHTIIPAFMERGDVHIGFGIMGGANQPMAHAQFVSNQVDYGMNLQEALEAPRFTKRTATGCDFQLESRVPLEAVQRLSELGHVIQLRREFSMAMGRGQAVMHNAKTKTNYAASDPRADGSAEPEPLP